MTGPGAEATQVLGPLELRRMEKAGDCHRRWRVDSFNANEARKSCLQATQRYLQVG